MPTERAAKSAMDENYGCHLVRVHIRPDVAAIIAAAGFPAINPCAAPVRDVAAATAVGHDRLQVELPWHLHDRLQVCQRGASADEHV